MKISSKQQGNALTELSVLALIMVPMVTLIPSLGKVSDVNQATIQASRYAAWERTVHTKGEKSDAQLAIEVRNRFYAHPDLLLESERGLITGDAGHNLYWSSHYDEDLKAVSMIRKETEKGITVSTHNNPMPSSIGAKTLAEGIATIGEAMSGLVPKSRWELEEEGFYVAEVQANMASHPLLGKGKDCGGEDSEDALACVSRRNAIFIDAWDSGSPDETEKRVRTLVPAGAFAPLADAVSTAGHAPLFEELRKLDGIFGDVREDVLPLDRYGDK